MHAAQNTPPQPLPTQDIPPYPLLSNRSEGIFDLGSGVGMGLICDQSRGARGRLATLLKHSHAQKRART